MLEGLSCRNLDLDCKFLTVYGGGGNYHAATRTGICKFLTVYGGGGNYHAATCIVIYTFITVYGGGGNYTMLQPGLGSILSYSV